MSEASLPTHTKENPSEAADGAGGLLQNALKKAQKEAEKAAKKAAAKKADEEKEQHNNLKQPRTLPKTTMAQRCLRMLNSPS